MPIIEYSQVSEKAAEIANQMDPNISAMLQNLSSETLNKVIQDTANQLFQQTDFLINANQSITATSEAIQQTLKALLEVLGGIGEVAGNMS